MADTPELDLSPSPQQPLVPAAAQVPRESIGDLIRTARNARRIAVETVARDLKLSVAYIQALENDQYDALPADPYVRVYLRSLARYLQLDPELILKRFYEASGRPEAVVAKETITRQDVQKIQSDKAVGIWVSVVLVVAALALTSFLLTRFGGPASGPAGSADSSAVADSLDTATALSDSLVAATVRSDSLSVPAIAPTADSVAGATARDTVVPVADSARPTRPVLHLTLRVVRDSSWVQVFSDGVSWKKTMRQGSKYFSARDSLNVHVGNNGVVQYILNGSAMQRFPEDGAVIFRLDRTRTPLKWTLSKWNAVFSGRL